MKFTYAQEIPGLTVGEHFDSNTPGLSLIVRESGKHSWTLLYRHNGKQKRWTLGRLDHVSLKEARTQVRKRSDDPVGDKKRQRLADSRTVSFEQLSERYIEGWAKPRQRFWKPTAASLQHKRFNPWKHRPVTEIERRDVRQLLADISGNGTANQTRALLHSLFNFAISQDVLLVNPVARIEKRPSVARERVLTDDEIRSAWGIPLFRMILLTGQRPDNVKQICRSEITDNVWTIPASTFKLKRTHVAPLVSTATETLAELPESGDRYFTPIECLGLIALLDKLGVPNARPKDLQRTVRTRLAMLNVLPDTAERIQGHVLPGIRSVYDRHDYFSQKYEALQRWESALLAIVDREPKMVINFKGVSK